MGEKVNELNDVVSPLFSSRNLANSCCPPPRLLGGFLMSLFFFQHPVFLLHFFSLQDMFYLTHSLYISAYIHVHVRMASHMALVTEVWFRQPSPVSLLTLDGSGAGSGSSQSGKGKFFLAGGQIW